MKKTLARVSVDKGLTQGLLSVYSSITGKKGTLRSWFGDDDEAYDVGAALLRTRGYHEETAGSVFRISETRTLNQMARQMQEYESRNPPVRRKGVLRINEEEAGDGDPLSEQDVIHSGLEQLPEEE